MNVNYFVEQPLIADPDTSLISDSVTDSVEALMAFAHAGAGADRRRKKRLGVQLPAQVRGTTGSGQRFELMSETTQLKDLSSNGLRLQLEQPVESGQRVLVLFPFAFNAAGNVEKSRAALLTSSTQTRIAVIGIVCRCKMQADGSYEAGVEIVHHRFLYGGDEKSERFRLF